MRKLKVLSGPCLALVAGVLLSEAFPATAALIYTSKDGWSVEGSGNNPSEASAVEQMAKIEELESNPTPANLESATLACKTLVKKFPDSALVPKARLKAAQILERRGEFEDSYEAYQSYLTQHPEGSDFSAAVESMFRIAKLFMDGQKRKIFGVPLAPSMEKAQEMFGGILKVAPYSKWAPLAQFHQGQVFERQKRDPEAIAAYRAVVSRHATDEIADDALYQIGYVLLREFREGSHDRAAADKAREAFEEFLSRYPDSEKVAQARENLESLKVGDVKTQLEVAKFYDRTKSYKAAVIYYNDVLKAQPSSPEATYAKNRISELRQQFGEDSLRSAPEKAETGEKVSLRKKLQARINTISRPDYVGPPVSAPADEVAPPKRPKLRTSSPDIGPVNPGSEPPLPEPELPKRNP